MKQVSDFDLKLLRIFVIVAEARGFAAAESYLNISTSTISVHMSNLEGRLGFRLCERGRSGFRMTERGQIVLEEAKKILKSMDDFAGKLASVNEVLAGRLSVGIVDGLVSHPEFSISDVVRELNSVENEIQIELVVAPRQILEHDVLEGRIHAAIGPFIRNSSGLEYAPLFREHHDLYCGVGHPLFDASRKKISRVDLSAYPAVVRIYHRDFDREHLGVLREKAVVNSMEAMLSLLLSGGYIGYLPKHYARKWVEEGRLFVIAKPGASYVSNHVMVTRQGSHESLASARFVSLVQERVRAANDNGA
jgi:DNA-binding transcriptional LysR family regulator